MIVAKVRGEGYLLSAILESCSLLVRERLLWIFRDRLFKTDWLGAIAQ